MTSRPWTERSRDDRFEHGSVWALAPGSDGSLYLVAGADERHVVVRLLVTESGLRAEGLATGRGTLAAGQARGTASGLTVMTIDRLDRPRAIDYDASRLPTPPHRWDRLCF